MKRSADKERSRLGETDSPEVGKARPASGEGSQTINFSALPTSFSHPKLHEPQNSLLELAARPFTLSYLHCLRHGRFKTPSASRQSAYH